MNAKRLTTISIMQEFIAALVPGACVMIYFFGAGIAINILVAVASAVATEIAILNLRGRSLAALADGSAIVTGVLLGICLPPLLPIWIIVLGAAFALVFGKHLYGGLGHNPFNPAMVGYAMLIVSFPLAMSAWPPVSAHMDLVTLLAYKLGAPLVDGITAATPLDAFRFRGSETVAEFYNTSTAMGQLAGWQWINAGFLLGGVYLVYRRLCHWLMPVTLLATLTLLAAVFYDSGSSGSLGSPVFHLFSGATMLGAFFIVTDPVTSPDSREGQVIFAIGIGILTFVIRSIGAYPEGLAFAVLLMNTATPLIDQARWRFAWLR